MYVADYVLMEYGTGAIMAVPGHDERDYAFARAYDLPIRRVIEGPASAAPDADPSAAETTEEGLPYTGDGPLVNSHPGLRRHAQSRGAERDRRLAGPRGQGPRVGQLPPARLAGLQPALLGLPDPDRQLRALRDRAGARGRAAGGAAGHRGLHAEGPLAAGGRGGVGARRSARSAAGRRAGRRTRWTRSSTRRGTSCATATRRTNRPPGTRRR